MTTSATHPDATQSRNSSTKELSLPPTENGIPRATCSTSRQSFAPDASIVLVGIRGCGKRSLGLIAATSLGRRFITEDYYFQKKTGLSRQDYLKLHGSEEFHRHDVEISCQMLEEHKSGCVIDCGLGSLTSALQDYLKVYSCTNPIIHIIRDMKSVRDLLKLNDRSVKLLENGDSTHRRCSNFEFFNLEDNSADSITEQERLDRGSPTYSFKLREAQADFSQFVKSITGMFGQDHHAHPAYSLDAPVHSQPFTHALRLPLSAYEDEMLDLPKLESGGDIVEILVDRWKSGSPRILSKMVADVRRNLKIPVMLMVDQDPSNLASESNLIIVRHSLRLAINFVVTNLAMSTENVSELRAMKCPTRFIGSIFLENKGSGKSPWLDGTATNILDDVRSQNFDMVRLSYKATSKEDNEDVRYFVHSLRQATKQYPIVIAYNTGELGRTSQVFNRNLTSVTHPELQQLPKSYLSLVPCITARECMQALSSSFVLDPLRFCIIGGNVSGSLSPVMHSAAYRLLGLSHTYTTKNIKSWDDVEDLAKDPNLGGASIVQPWKVRLVSKVAHLSEHARTIGAINTLIPLRSLPDGSVPPLAVQAAHRNRSGPIAAWYGDNTDWIAMSCCVSRSLSPRNVIQPKSTALVVGAGGMARSAVYALIKLGCRNIFVYNRTVKNAENLAEHYISWLAGRDQPTSAPLSNVKVIKSRDEAWPADHNPPTIIISCVTHEHLEGNPDANFTMPLAWLRSDSGGVVVELAYMTRETPLITQIKRHREATGVPWVVVDGIETLFEQALAQFEIMTGRQAPPRCMRNALNKAIQERQTFVADGEEFETIPQ